MRFSHGAAVQLAVSACHLGFTLFALPDKAQQQQESLNHLRVGQCESWAFYPWWRGGGGAPKKKGNGTALKNKQVQKMKLEQTILFKLKGKNRDDTVVFTSFRLSCSFFPIE